MACPLYFCINQDRLYQEIQKVCGSEMVAEEHLSQLPYLNAVFHETLRKHSPAALVPLRYAHEDTQLGGYYIPAGTEVTMRYLAFYFILGYTDTVISVLVNCVLCRLL